MTDLSETIARLEDGIALETNHPGSVRISPECARSLLATARRVQAMEAAGGLVAELRGQSGPSEEDFLLLLDLASDQSAARARVTELEQRVDELEFSCGMACETPADGCQCAGCLLADERNARGEL